MHYKQKAVQKNYVLYISYKFNSFCFLQKHFLSLLTHTLVFVSCVIKKIIIYFPIKRSAINFENNTR